jgi:hypothetical protein
MKTAVLCVLLSCAGPPPYPTPDAAPETPYYGDCCQMPPTSSAQDGPTYPAGLPDGCSIQDAAVNITCEPLSNGSFVCCQAPPGDL